MTSLLCRFPHHIVNSTVIFIQYSCDDCTVTVTKPADFYLRIVNFGFGYGQVEEKHKNITERFIISVRYHDQEMLTY